MANSVSVHYKNLQYLATELHKVFIGIFLVMMKDVFPLNTVTIISGTDESFIQGLLI